MAGKKITAARKGVPRARRLPTHAHGEGVVDLVIDAAHRLLAEEGYDALTTNRVARRAGVSVGSLYHYFPTKEAIVAELARRLETRGLEMAMERFARGADWPVPELVRALVAILLSPDIGIIAARRTLLRRVPPRWFADASTAADREVRSWVSALIAQGRAGLRDGPPDVMAFVAFHAVEGVVEAAIERRAELVADPAFFEDLVALLVGYVSSNAPDASGKPDSRRGVGGTFDGE